MINDKPLLIEDARVEDKAILFFFQHLTKVSMQTMIFPFLVLWIFWGITDHLVLIGWFIVIQSIYFSRIILSKAFLKSGRQESDQSHWVGLFTGTAILSGISWGLAPLVFNSQETTVSSQVFIYVLIIGMAAASLIHTVNIRWPVGFIAFVLPSMGLSVLSLVIIGGEGEYIVALVFVLYFITLIRVGKELKVQIYEGIRLQFENADLAKDLKQQRDLAETANQAKTRFLASANHDLRQPIHALSILIHAIKNEIHSEHGKHIQNQMTQASRHLNALLESLLDLSKLDAQCTVPNLKGFSLQMLLSRLVADFQSNATNKNIKLILHPTVLSVYSDSILLERLVGNLIQNAVNYTQTGGVLIGVRKKGDFASIEIWDTGIGINREELNQIFKEFYQVENSGQRSLKNTQGLGLGLAICKRLSELLSHPLSFESRVKSGSVFKVLVPIYQQGFLTTGTDDRKELNADITNNAELCNKTILVVDDDAHSLKAMKSLITSWQGNVLSAENSSLALAFLDRTIDLVITDYHLGIDERGTKLINIIRTGRNQLDLPAIIITGDTSSESIRILENFGSPVLHKPINPNELYKLVIEALW